PRRAPPRLPPARSPRPERTAGARARAQRLATSAARAGSADAPPAPPRRAPRRGWTRRPANGVATRAVGPPRVPRARPPRTVGAARRETCRASAGLCWAGGARRRRCALPSQGPRQLDEPCGPRVLGQYAPSRRLSHRPRGLGASHALSHQRGCLRHMTEGQHFSPYVEGVFHVLVVLRQVAAAVAGELHVAELQVAAVDALGIAA